VRCWVDEVEWTRVADFAAYGPYDTVFVASYNRLYFGDNVNGKLPTGSQIKIRYYYNEVVYSTYYANGMIAVPYDIALKGTSVYVYVECYNTPSYYYEFIDPIIDYTCDYISKPSPGSMGPGMGGDAILHTITPIDPVRLIV
jgi:hypothetical protein